VSGGSAEAGEGFDSLKVVTAYDREMPTLFVESIVAVNDELKEMESVRHLDIFEMRRRATNPLLLPAKDVCL